MSLNKSQKMVTCVFQEGLNSKRYNSHERRRGPILLIAGVLIFSIVVFILSAVISKRREKMDRAEMATYILLIAWASLLLGIALMKWEK